MLFLGSLWDFCQVMQSDEIYYTEKLCSVLGTDAKTIYLLAKTAGNYVSMKNGKFALTDAGIKFKEKQTLLTENQ